MALKKITDRSYRGVSGRVAVILSEFHPKISDGLLNGLERVFEGIEGLQWQVHRVPGAFEIPLMAQRLACLVAVHDDGQEEPMFDVIVALGCIVKGDTYHFEMVANECARGCMEVMLEEDIPVVMEVLAPYSLKEGLKRSSGEHNHGKLAAYTALEWLNLMKDDKDDKDNNDDNDEYEM
ncbi:MAG: 6,7-dimethyl-8-ribityllumazine synthase [bacterium]|nr:6,7-dimethyl-8-ribityllumazine synthase [bacterium]